LTSHRGRHGAKEEKEHNSQADEPAPDADTQPQTPFTGRCRIRRWTTLLDLKLSSRGGGLGLLFKFLQRFQNGTQGITFLQLPVGVVTSHLVKL
jgi:hypothetical protein